MMTQNGKAILYYSEPKTISSLMKSLFSGIQNAFAKKATVVIEAETDFESDLAFDELNPLLAKQLTEVESQLGQLAMIQHEMVEERRRMHAEMRAIKSLVLATAIA